MKISDFDFGEEDARYLSLRTDQERLAYKNLSKFRGVSNLKTSFREKSFSSMGLKDQERQRYCNTSSYTQKMS